jgi:hypothetical protein
MRHFQVKIEKLNESRVLARNGNLSRDPSIIHFLPKGNGGGFRYVLKPERGTSDGG